MKAAIPLGMILLLGAAAALHRASPPRAASPERRAGVVPLGVAAEASSAPKPAVPSPVVAEVGPVTPPRPAAAGSDRKASGPSSARMTAVLDRELTLTPLQRDAVEQLLKDRDGEIKACHVALVRSGVIDIPRYEWEVREMKEGWYRRVDALLDRAQHERFLVLVQQGLFNEGLAFTVQPGMTVLD